MDDKSQKAFELAAAFYRLAKLCPEGDILVAKIKGSALNILEYFIKDKDDRAKQEILVLLDLLKLARLQEWVNVNNFEILERGYAFLIKSSKTEPILKFVTKAKSFSPSNSILNQRQKDILDFLATKQDFRLKQVKEAFSKVSDKTLRNDLKTLVNQGFLKREGQGAGSVYEVIRQ